MKTLILAAIAASLTLGAAQARPGADFLPQTDYTAQTRINDGRTMIDATLRHSEGRFRVEGAYQGQPAVILIDARSGVNTVLMDMQGFRVAMDAPSNGAIERVTRVSDSRQYLGESEAAGEACALYRIRDDESGEEADVCLTADNIVLRAVTPSQGVVFEVVSLDRAAQPASAFTVPAGYQRMAAPDMNALGALVRPR